jgi:hypothetical protein
MSWGRSLAMDQSIGVHSFVGDQRHSSLGRSALDMIRKRRGLIGYERTEISARMSPGHLGLRIRNQHDASHQYAKY